MVSVHYELHQKLCGVTTACVVFQLVRLQTVRQIISVHSEHIEASMSRGHGYIQDYLMKIILHSPDPLTFAEIMAIAFPEGSYESDVAKIIGESNVGSVRSLRRALKRLCDDGSIMMIGKGGRGDPHRYWVDPMMLALSGDKEWYEEVCKRIEADPALTAAANASAHRIMGRLAAVSEPE
jgi:hypothetical protein